MTDLEKRLAFALADLVQQHLPDKSNPGQYESGCIRASKEALVLLVELGVMEAVYPQQLTEPYRWMDAKFVEHWEWKLGHDQLTDNG